MTDKVLLVVPVDEADAEQLTKQLNSSGFEVSKYSDIDGLLEAVGFDPVEVEPVDVSEYEQRKRQIDAVNMYKSNGEVKMLSHIAWALTDLAKTHRQSMPPLA